MWAMPASTGCKGAAGSKSTKTTACTVVGGVVPGAALGTGPHIEIDYRCLEAEAGDLYPLATDGPTPTWTQPACTAPCSSFRTI